MEEKDKTYRPADSAAIEAKAKSMDKKELEEYYIKDKHSRHVPAILIVVLVIAALALLFLIGSIGGDIVNDRVNENIRDVGENFVDEICPMLGDYEFTLQEKHGFLGLDELKVKCYE